MFDKYHELLNSGNKETQIIWNLPDSKLLDYKLGKFEKLLKKLKEKLYIAFINVLCPRTSTELLDVLPKYYIY